MILSAEEEAAALKQAKMDKYWRLYDERVKQMREDFVAEIKRPWNAAEQLEYLQVRLQELKIPQSAFDRIYAQNPDAVNHLCMYFTNDPEFRNTGEDRSLEKGILLYGYVGTGKTTLMRLFSRNKKTCYDMLECIVMQELFCRDGDKPIEIFSKIRYEPKDPRFFFQTQIGCYFDDLGTEEIPATYYGNKRNVMAEIIMNRYGNRHDFDFTKTHMTTNKTMKEIHAMYGTRAYDRVKEMFNLIELKGDSLRR